MTHDILSLLRNTFLFTEYFGLPGLSRTTGRASISSLTGNHQIRPEETVTSPCDVTALKKADPSRDVSAGFPAMAAGVCPPSPCPPPELPDLATNLPGDNTHRGGLTSAPSRLIHAPKTNKQRGQSSGGKSVRARERTLTALPKYGLSGGHIWECTSRRSLYKAGNPH